MLNDPSLSLRVDVEFADLSGPAWLCSGYVSSEQLLELSAEVEFAGIDIALRPRHTVVTPATVGNLMVDVSLERPFLDVTFFNDDSYVYQPGPPKRVVTVTFETSDMTMRPGKMIKVRLPNGIENIEPVMIQRVEHRSYGQLRVEATSVHGRKYAVSDYDRVGTGVELHPNCRCINIAHAESVDAFLAGTLAQKRKVLRQLQGERKMAPRNAKTPKFYVASTAISRSLVPGGVDQADGRIVRPANLTADYVKHTEKEAVEMARALVEKDGEARYIVKIVKVVRRKPMPITVESVK